MNRANFIGILSAATTLFFVTSFASAATVNLTTDSTDSEEMASISGWETTGNTMDGMAVTVFFQNGGSETVSWADNVGAVGSGWSLTMTDYDSNTLITQFVFDVESGGQAVDGFLIDALAGDTVFDILSSGEHTPGSAYGWSFDIETYYAGDIVTNYDGVISARYSTELYLPGQQVYGDLYRYLDVSFENGFSDDDVLAFYVDTDNLYSPIPEPAALLLFGLGVTALAGLRRKR